MMSRSLIRREVLPNGLFYRADDSSAAFLNNLTSRYIVQLRERAEWVAARFDDLSDAELDTIVKRLFEAWTIEFQPIQLSPQAELF
jgi:hypothetical protein